MGKRFSFIVGSLAGLLFLMLSGGGDFSKDGLRNSLRIAQNETYETVMGDLVEEQVGGAEKSEGAEEDIVEEEIAEEDVLEIFAFGDMMLGRYVRTLMDRHGMDYIFEKLPEGFFEGFDIVHGNLEGPIWGKGRSGGTSMVFAFNEDIPAFLAKWGFNLMSIANNHAVDMGWEGRASTMKGLSEAGVGWCGHPSEADPESVYYGKKGELSYAFVCLHSVTFPLDEAAAVELIKKVDAEVDLVFVSIHWGNEYQHKANLRKQVEPARSFVDAGADFIIGHHPHVVQNFEIYQGRPIFYSLGNFVFDQYWSTETKEELALDISIGKDGGKIVLVPMLSERSQSRLMNEEELARWTDEFLGYSDYDEETVEMIRDGVLEFNF